MDQPQSDKEPNNAMHVVIDEVRAPRGRIRAGHPERWPGLVALGAILFGLSAFAFSGWVYVEGQREIIRLSTELAQLKVSLDLYVRNGGSSAGLTELTERLTELEQAARSNAVPMPAPPPATAETATTTAPATDEDCLPEGMRLLVAAGDSYPICGQAAEVAVSFVDNGYITLSDGTSVASGGTTPLPGSACTIAVTSGGDEGLTGYAEIRVTC
jgi:hypothetical protein